MRRAALFTFLLLWAPSCGGSRPPPSPPPKPAWTRYAEALEATGLAQREVGRRWFAAGDRAVAEAAAIDPPYIERVYFSPIEPDARGFEVQLRRGQRLVIDLKQAEGNAAGDLFVDLFAPAFNETKPPVHLLGVERQAHVELEAKWDGPVFVRVQPEIFGGGRYDVEITRGPSVGFPVQDHDARAVKSFFGAPRDGGARRHEGVDIFADKGTPIVSVSDGIVMRTGNDRLGGKVVWVLDRDRRLGFYYAHLDTQAVRRGARVKRGDLLGTVGNTGNAIHTPSHLHFGIYAPRAVDPFPFIEEAQRRPAPLRADADLAGAWLRVRSRRAKLVDAPAGRALVKRDLARATAARALGSSGDWTFVALPDGERGFLPRRAVEPVEKPVRRLKAASRAMEVLDSPREDAVSTATTTHRPIAILAEFDGYWLVEHGGGSAWIRAMP
ncbi:MAG: M23 family metallopeptidase [Deltaproteobacteria bacterium]|nr:M23 family metallopeptidase [Deltaproteobacteria bacterium]